MGFSINIYSFVRLRLQHGNSIVARSFIQKDLGLTFDGKLSFVNHLQRNMNSAYKMLGFVLRNSKNFKSVDVLKTLYVSLVGSGLEYASVWAPHYLYSKAGLERVQRRFLKHFFYMSERHFPPRGLEHALMQGCLRNSVWL
jgi:hypothetical protein